MMQVLVVEDNAQNRSLLVRYLQRRGYATMEADDAETALQICMTERPDLIVLDVALPQMSGVDLMRALRARVASRDIPVVVVTSFDAKRVECFDAGCKAFFVKPVDIDALVATIETLDPDHAKAALG